MKKFVFCLTLLMMSSFVMAETADEKKAADQLKYADSRIKALEPQIKYWENVKKNWSATCEADKKNYGKTFPAIIQLADTCEKKIDEYRNAVQKSIDMWKNPKGDKSDNWYYDAYRYDLCDREQIYWETYESYYLVVDSSAIHALELNKKKYAGKTEILSLIDQMIVNKRKVRSMHKQANDININMQKIENEAIQLNLKFNTETRKK